MTEIAISVENLSKRYLVGHNIAQVGRYSALRDVLARNVRNLVRKTSDMLGGRQIVQGDQVEEFWALKDVSFEVKRGEVLGVIGRNGAGKSTLLKILSRITEPTKGRVKISGRVASLLEVGTGFHPELTGRENIFLNGAILGMSRTEIKRKFDEIVDFAEVEKFLDTPVKHYSSGMYVRLAFSVAAHLEPDILIVDEVLAVGDAEFQKKCFGKMEEVASGGRTILLVSHNMAAIKKMSTKALLLTRGTALPIGDAEAVVNQYLQVDQQRAGTFSLVGRHFPPRFVELKDAWLLKDNSQIASFMFDETVTLVMNVLVHETARFNIELILRNSEGAPIAVCSSGLSYGWEISASPGQVTGYAHLPPARLAEGKYYIDIMLSNAGVEYFDYIESAIMFSIEDSAIGPRNWRFSQKTGQGCHHWDVRFSREEMRLSLRDNLGGRHQLSHTGNPM